MKIDFDMLKKVAAAGASADVLIVMLEEQREKNRKDYLRNAPRRAAGPITIMIRQAVYDRDQWQCVYCGSEEDLTCDHVIPVKRGGLSTLENLVTACRVCSAKKRDRDRKVFERDLGKQKKSDRAPRKSVEISATETPSQIAERELYARGKQLCGKSAGGLISSLVRHHNYDLSAARAVLETASTKQDPREWVVASMRSNRNGQGSSLMATADDLIARAKELERQAGLGEPDDQAIEGA